MSYQRLHIQSLKNHSGSFFLLLTLTFMFLYNTSFAQRAQEQFGKNRIQHKQFDWKFISTQNFDIYYYQGGFELAKAAANYAESDFQRISDQTGYTPGSKIKLLIYNTAYELDQSNIGLDLNYIVAGGQTQFIKSKVEVAFKGTQARFKKELSFHISKLMISMMFYGGSLKDIVESTYLLSLPDWFINGASAYISEGWSVEMDDYMRDKVRKGTFHNPRALTGRDARLTGQAIWNYIAEKYGHQNIPNILNLSRIIRNEESGIESSLGVPFRQFIKEWEKYYQSMNDQLEGSYVDLSKENRITKNRRAFYYRNLKMSPDGKKVSYLRNFNGKLRLIVYDVEKKKKKVLYRGGQRVLNQEEDPNLILHNWRTSDKIVFTERKKNNLYLHVVDLSTGKKDKRIINDFNQFNSISFSKDGEYMIVSADKAGQSDIYIYSFKDNTFRQITNDLYDDINPVFIEDSYSFAFSSNRISDTLQKEINFSYKDTPPLFNIFIMNLKNKENYILKRVTNYSNNDFPFAISNNELLYLSDEKGIRNIHKYSISDDATSQVTNHVRNINEYAVTATGIGSYTSILKGKERVFVEQNFSLQSVADPILTERQKKFELSHPRIKEVKEEKEIKEDKEINLNDYHFESDDKKKENKTSTVPSTKNGKLALNSNTRFSGPHRYLNFFAVDKLNSTFLIDPLRGTGILLEAFMTDMMGNHLINAGLFAISDLKSSSLFGEYQYLKRRVDYKLRYDRYVVNAANDIVDQRYTLSQFTGTAAYPISKSSRISASPFFAMTRFTDLSFNAKSYADRDPIKYYGGFQGRYLFDNTTIKGLNMIQGSRAKITFDQYVSPSNSSNNFGKLVIDLRHYQAIHKDLVIATRASYGQFLGKAKKNFLLGGMDNWLFNSTNHPKHDDPLTIAPFFDNSDLLFVQYVTNMRGFIYNAQNGTKFVLFNAEVRWPVIKYFYNGVINSNFLKHLQLIGFTDVGAAWSGKSLFGTDNSTNTTTVTGGPFSAKVTNFKNPFLIGYGFGARTMFLDYYIKGDLAWGVVDNQIVSRKFYLTFGFDF